METFTVFIVVPSEDVCSLRQLTSGVTVKDIRSRLEIIAGLPAQTYKLCVANGKFLYEDHEFILHKNVWDGFIIRAQLHESWQPLYDAILRGDVGWVIRSGAVYTKPDTIHENSEKDQGIVNERGSVALYWACWYGQLKMCQVLLSVGVNPNGRTPFKRTAIFATAAKDHDRLLETLIQHGAKMSLSDYIGTTARDLAKKNFSRQCLNRLHTLQLMKKNPKNKGDTTSTSTIAMVNKRNSFENRPKTAAQINKMKEGYTQKFNPLASTSEDGRIYYSRENTLEISKSTEYLRTSTPKLDLTDEKNVPIGANFRVLVSSPTGSKSVTSLNRTIELSSSLVESEALHIKPAKREGKFKMPTYLGIRPESISEKLYECNYQTDLTPHPPTVSPTVSESNRTKSIISAPGHSVNIPTHSVDSRSIESAPTGRGHHVLSARKRQSPRPKRLLQLREKENKNSKIIKRRIGIAEQQRRKSTEKRRETFDEWLYRKRLQEYEHEESSSDESDSDKEEKNKRAFDNWLKELRERAINQPNPRSTSSLNKRRTGPIQGLITVSAENSNFKHIPSDSSTYMNALKVFKERQKKDKKADSSPVKTSGDARQRLELKRQQLLAEAVSFNEWMEHTEEKKHLLKLILQADSSNELDAIVQTSFKPYRTKVVTFQDWKQKLEEREKKQKIDQANMRRDMEEQRQKREEDERIASSKKHTEWLRKNDVKHLNKREQQRPSSAHPRSRVSPQTNQTNFDAWVKNKHLTEVAQIDNSIRKEKQMLLTLRHRKQISQPAC